MANTEKYNELAGVNEKERQEKEKARQERQEKQQEKREEARQNMEENREPEHESKLTFEDQVIEKIASIACNEIQGVLDMKGGFFSGVQEQFGGHDMTKGVNASVGEKETSIDLSIILEYGQSAPRVFEELKENVGKNISQMTGLKVNEVNVKVEDVMTRKEFEQKKRQSEERSFAPNFGQNNYRY